MQAPTFTVVMPAFNAGSTIEASIRSVLDQTYGDFELIVVDDGSTDDTLARVRPFEVDPRVNTLCQANKGLAGARNAAITRARGRYVSLLDSDDLWLPSYLEVMGRAMDADPEASMAYADAWVLDEKTRRIGRAKALTRQKPPVPAPQEPPRFLAELLLRNFVFGLVTIRRSTLEQVGLFATELRACEDHEMWLRMLAHGHRIIHVPELLSIYRRRPGSLSADYLGMARNSLEMYRIVVERHPLTTEQLARAQTMMAKRVRDVATYEGRRPVFARMLGLRRRMSGLRLKALDRRHWYATPPQEIATIFPDLRVL